MRFPGFYGNHSLRARLAAAQAGGGLSHCYILVGPKGSGKKTLSKIIAAALECTGSGDKPCGVCPSCHKIFGGGHPDVITVDSDKATVPIKVIREMQADAYIRPNEGQKKIYLLPRAQDMQAPAQNALLKLLEEPPEYCVFLLMTDNAEKLLTTVRSRAVELSLFPLSDRELTEALETLAPNTPREALAAAAEKSFGYLGAALELLQENSAESPITPLLEALATGDELALLSALVPLEKLKRQELLEALQQLHLLLTRALGKKSGGDSLSSRETQLLAEGCTGQRLFAVDRAVNTAIGLLQANGSPGHCVGYLMGTL
jgi:DNA polymerase-3 subunit delta'